MWPSLYMNHDLIVGLGYVGQTLAKALMTQGRRVDAIKRQPLAHNHNALTLIEHDLTTHPPKLARAYDRVYFMLGATSRSAEAYQNTYIKALQHTLEALPSAQHFFFISSTSVYHQNDGQWVDESMATDPQHFTGQIMLQAETLALATPYPSTVLRCSGIYGPGRTHLIERIQKQSIAVPHPQCVCKSHPS